MFRLERIPFRGQNGQNGQDNASTSPDASQENVAEDARLSKDVKDLRDRLDQMMDMFKNQFQRISSPLFLGERLEMNRQYEAFSKERNEFKKEIHKTNTTMKDYTSTIHRTGEKLRNLVATQADDISAIKTDLRKTEKNHQTNQTWLHKRILEQQGVINAQQAQMNNMVGWQQKTFEEIKTLEGQVAWLRNEMWQLSGRSGAPVNQAGSGGNTGSGGNGGSGGGGNTNGASGTGGTGSGGGNAGTQTGGQGEKSTVVEDSDDEL
ncbi:hypothetical protein LTR64_002219 [Lithohypha guttulata]|uniref:uncharacterized protein n=1 Tax=Lithohypha guttulata TaxID=1690604 RepID=UPI002DDE23DB|nr:hypothetical protein LTR51_001554 [Lithohypha guttulata]